MDKKRIGQKLSRTPLGTVSIRFGCYRPITRGYAESDQNTVDKTKILNDTAVEFGDLTVG